MLDREMWNFRTVAAPPLPGDDGALPLPRPAVLGGVDLGGGGGD